MSTLSLWIRHRMERAVHFDVFSFFLSPNVSSVVRLNALFVSEWPIWPADIRYELNGKRKTKCAHTKCHFHCMTFVYCSYAVWSLVVISSGSSKVDAECHMQCSICMHFYGYWNWIFEWFYQHLEYDSPNWMTFVFLSATTTTNSSFLWAETKTKKKTKIIPKTQRQCFYRWITNFN